MSLLRALRSVAAACAALSICSAVHAESSAPPLAIVDVTVIDVSHARHLDGRTVLIDNGRIAAVGKNGEIEIPRDAVRVDGRGRFLVPGLIDMHVHLFNNSSHRPPNDWAFPLFVGNGVTGVREMSSLPEQVPLIAQWRADIERGALVAPRVLAAGIPVRGDSVDAARTRVREAVRAGAGFIKIFSEVPAPQWRAIIDEAHEQHIRVDGHVPASVTLLDAARAGQRTAEHLMQVYEACSLAGAAAIAARRDLTGDAAVALRDEQERDVLEHFDATTCHRTAVLAARTHQVQVPTLVLDRFEASRAGVVPSADPRWPLLRADEQARWQRALAASDDDAKLATRRWKVSCDIARTLADAGVPLLAGTDTPMPLNYPGYSLHDELELLAECGLDPAAALRAATTLPAQTLGLADLGAVESGKRADLVLLDADPLRDVRNLRRIRAVILAGRLLPRAQLDAMLATAPRAGALTESGSR